MLDLVEDLKRYKNVWILNSDITREDMELIQYHITAFEYRGINKFYAQLKTNSQNKQFKKIINLVGFRLEFSNKPNYKVFESKYDAIRYFCKQLKLNPEKNKNLLKKLKKNHIQYFI